MKKFLTFLIATLVLCLPVNAQESPKETSADKKVTARFTNSNIYDVISYLNREHNLNIILDMYAPGQVYPLFLDWKDVSVQEAIRTLAKALKREVHIIGTIFILRQQQWAVAIRQDKDPEVMKLFPWKNEGMIQVQRHPDQLTPIDKRFPSTEFAEWMRTTYQTPAQRISIRINTAKAGDIVSELASTSFWKIRISPEVKNRRLTAAITNVNPAELLAAMAFLLNAGPEVALIPSDAQNAAFSDAADDRMPWDKASDKLRPEIMKLLTNEEKQALQNGEKVEVSVERMPKELQTMVRDYVKMNAQIMLKDVGEIDYARWREVKITFLPPRQSPNGSLGIAAPSTEGVMIYF
jgi:hypothetical protein